MANLIDAGKKAPAFRLLDQDDRTHQLKDYLGQWVVIFFYPRDNTPGCTNEACQFRDAEQALIDRGAVVVGISPQGTGSKNKFATKHALNFPVLADDENRVCEKYGVWQPKKLYGKSLLGVVRTTYIIDPAGRVAQRFDKVKVEDHAAKVLESLDKLQAQ